MPTLQIIVSETEKKQVERLVLKMNLFNNEDYSVSSFLSSSIMDLVKKLENDLPLIPGVDIAEK
jgi:hypothetical protein